LPCLLIVPRHPQRFDAVAALIEAQGFAVSRRSTWVNGGPPPASANGRPTVWLGDSLGEMSLYYGLVDVALLGGSFEPLGGQNLIEATACECPVVMGPHTFNFSDAARLAEQAGAALRVGSLLEGLGAATALAADPARLAATQQAAQSFSRAHQGATVLLVDAICELLSGAAPTGRAPG
jgi:3-deoxy-D-manno-octulosonic-acid transferase